ncbi:MAG TPA: hypothetical protein DCS79_03540 [Gammaproteobacteria bacterium]|nr:hypothetical protein [Gammaproteobacteria bacterium]
MSGTSRYCQNIKIGKRCVVSKHCAQS